MSVTVELSLLDADLWDAFKRGGEWVPASEYRKLMAQNTKLREENAKLVKVLHEVESEAVDAYFCLQHDCELLVGELEDRFRKHWHEQCENDKLRKLLQELYEDQCDDGDQWKYRDRICELGIEVEE